MAAVKYDADTIPCCVECDKFNATKICKKCAVVFCRHYASVTDNRFCINCISDFTIRETIMEKQVSHERPDGVITFSRKYQARHITLQGTDWLFAAALIETMDDAEIEATIEYHRANVGLMIQERESRKLERFKKLSGIKITHTPRTSQHDLDQAAKKSKSKTKVKEKEITLEAMSEMIAKLMKSGLTKEQLTSLMGETKK